MAHRIVHKLEVIQVDIQKSDLAMVPRSFKDGVFERFFEVTPVGKPGQGVVGGETREFFAGALLAGDVFHQRNGVRFTLPLQERNAGAAPYQLTVLTNELPFGAITVNFPGEKHSPVVRQGGMVFGADQRADVFAGHFFGTEARDIAKTTIERMDAASRIQNQHAYSSFLKGIAKAEVAFPKRFVHNGFTQDAFAKLSYCENDIQRKNGH